MFKVRGAKGMPSRYSVSRLGHPVLAAKIAPELMSGWGRAGGGRGAGEGVEGVEGVLVIGSTGGCENIQVENIFGIDVEGGGTGVVGMRDVG